MSPAELSRRALAAGAASAVSAAAVAAPRAAAAATLLPKSRVVDPIFTAIKVHRKSEAEWLKANDAFEDAEDGEIKDRAALCDNRAMEEMHCAEASMLAIQPTSVAGCAALIAYVLTSAAEARWSVEALESVVASLKRIAALPAEGV